MALIEQVVPMSHDQIRLRLEGDPVTYIIVGLLIHGRATWSFDHGSYTGRSSMSIRRRDTGGNIRECVVPLAEEGLTWVRGHVTEKDESGQALLAADALTRESRQAPVLRFDKNTPTAALRGMVFPLDSHGHPHNLPVQPGPDDVFHVEVGSAASFVDVNFTAMFGSQ